MLELAAAGTRHLGVFHVATSVDGGLGTGRNGNVLEDGVDGEYVLAVLDELHAEFLGKLVRLATLGGAVLNVILHEIEQGRVGSVHDADALAHDLSVNGLESAENDVVVHAQGILASPVPGGIVDTGLERAEDWLNTSRVEVAMFGVPEVQLSLEDLGGFLRNLERLVTGADVHLEIPREELQLLLEQRLLVARQRFNGGGVHHHAAAGASGRTGSRSSRQADARVRRVLLRSSVEEALGVCLGPQTRGGLHGDGEQEDTVLTTRTESPPCLEVFPSCGDVEASRHLGGNQASDKTLCCLAEVAIERSLHGRAELVQGCVFWLLWC